MSRRRYVGAGVAAVAAVAVGGFLVGQAHADTTSWHRGRAYVGAHVMSVQVGGWTYGVRDSVPWVDERGSFHEGGWPACLEGAAGRQVDVRFAATKVRIAGMGWRQVVLVDCR